MPDGRLSQLLRNPEFRSLAPEDRRQVMRVVDSEFAALPDTDQLSIAGNLPPLPLEKSLGRKALDIAADIVPPSLGAAGGAKLGASAMASIAPPYGVLVGAAGGAALGAMGGESLHQLLKSGAKMFGVEPLGAPVPETSLEAAGRIAEAGAFGPVQEAGRLAGIVAPGVAKSITPVQALSTEFNVPVTKAQQTQGIVRSAFESLARRSLFGSGAFQRFDQYVNKRLVNAGQGIADEISTQKMTPLEAGRYVQQALGQAAEEASGAYEQAIGKISQQAGSAQLDVMGPLRTAATELLDQWKKPTAFSPGTRQVESVSKAIGILEDFAQPTRKVTSPVLDALGRTMEREVPKTLTFDDARALRTLLFRISNSGEVDIGKGALAQLNHALDAAMKEALEKTGNRDLVGAFEAASSSYRHTRELLEQSTMAALAKSDTPEAILGQMLQTNRSESAVATFKELVKRPQTRDAVERGLWNHILTESEQEGVLVGNRLERTLERLGDDALKTMFEPERLAKIKRFAALADTISLRSSLTRPISAQGPTLMALGQSGVAGGALVYGGPKAWMIAGTTLVPPYVMARMLTRPGAVEVATQALRVPAASPAGQRITARLLAISGMTASKARRDEQGRVTIPLPQEMLPPPPR